MKWCKIKFCYSLFLIAILFWIFSFVHFEAVDVNEEKEPIIRRLHVDVVSRRPPLYATNNSSTHLTINSIAESWPCEPRNDIEVLFFNRIAKCASTSFVELLQKLSHVGNFDVIFNRQGAYDWTHWEVALVTAQINRVMERGHKRIAFAQHFYYMDFSPNLHNYGYVTLVREPVQRMISSFNYYHYSKKDYIKRMLPKDRKDETLLDCIKMEHEGCKHNLMTKYFCGHTRNCSNGSSKALKIAKYNLKNKFIAVGLVENLTQSVELFQQLVPAYFPPMPAANLAKLLPYTNQNSKIAQADSQIIKAIEIRNQADIELYQYAKDLFFSRLKACNV